jgi:hypothetical protein
MISYQEIDPHLSKVGSLILKITRPRTFGQLSQDTGTSRETYSEKKECPGSHDSKIHEGAETTPQKYEGNCDACLQAHGILGGFPGRM